MLDHDEAEGMSRKQAQVLKVQSGRNARETEGKNFLVH